MWKLKYRELDCVRGGRCVVSKGASQRALLGAREKALHVPGSSPSNPLLRMRLHHIATGDVGRLDVSLLRERYAVDSRETPRRAWQREHRRSFLAEPAAGLLFSPSQRRSDSSALPQFKSPRDAKPGSCAVTVPSVPAAQRGDQADTSHPAGIAANVRCNPRRIFAP